MPDETWIKVYRKLKDNPISSNLELLGFLTYLMLDVNHKNNSFYIGEKRIDLKAGQKLTSQRKLAEQFNISLSKVNRFLKILTKEKILKHEGNSKFTIVTLLNWDRYNGSETLIEHEKNARRMLKETNNNEKNNKNEKNNIYIGATRSEVLLELDKLINYWNDTFSENRKVTPKLESVYLGVRKKYPKDDISNALQRYTKEKLKGDPNYWLDPLRFLTQNNGFVKYL